MAWVRATGRSLRSVCHEDVLTFMAQLRPKLQGDDGALQGGSALVSAVDSWRPWSYGLGGQLQSGRGAVDFSDLSYCSHFVVRSRGNLWLPSRDLVELYGKGSQTKVDINVDNVIGARARVLLRALMKALSDAYNYPGFYVVRYVYAVISESCIGLPVSPEAFDVNYVAGVLASSGPTWTGKVDPIGNACAHLSTMWAREIGFSDILFRDGDRFARGFTLDSPFTHVEWSLVNNALLRQRAVHAGVVTVYWASPNVCLGRLSDFFCRGPSVVVTSHRVAADAFSRVWPGGVYMVLSARRAKAFARPTDYVFVHVAHGCSGGSVCAQRCLGPIAVNA